MSRVYNSPAALYSEENLAAALQESGLKNAEAGQEMQNRFLTVGDDQSQVSIEFKCCPIRGQYFLSFFQDHITDNNNKDVMDSGKFVPVAVTSNPVANSGVSSGKQKVGGKIKKKLNNKRDTLTKSCTGFIVAKKTHNIMHYDSFWP